MIPRPWAASGLVLLAVTLFSINASVSALVLQEGMSPLALTTFRAMGTALLLGLGLVVTGRGRMLAVGRREWPLLLVYGVAGVALIQWAYFVAIDRLPIGLALLLEYLAPLLIALVARFGLRQPVSALLWPALGLALGGLALATRVDGGPLDPIGVAAALLAACAFATYFLLGERLVASRDAVSTTFWGFAIAAVAATAATAGQLPAGARVLAGSAELPGALGGGGAPVAVLVAWVVVLGTLVPFLSITLALGWLPATPVSITGTGEVVGAALVAWWWFGQRLTSLQAVGFAMVVTGVALALAARRTGQVTR